MPGERVLSRRRSSMLTERRRAGWRGVGSGIAAQAGPLNSSTSRSNSSARLPATGFSWVDSFRFASAMIYSALLLSRLHLAELLPESDTALACCLYSHWILV